MNLFNLFHAAGTHIIDTGQIATRNLTWPISDLFHHYFNFIYFMHLIFSQRHRKLIKKIISGKKTETPPTREAPRGKSGYRTMLQSQLAFWTMTPVLQPQTFQIGGREMTQVHTKFSIEGNLITKMIFVKRRFRRGGL